MWPKLKGKKPGEKEPDDGTPQDDVTCFADGTHAFMMPNAEVEPPAQEMKHD